MTNPIYAADSIDVRLGGRPILRAAYVDAVPGTVTALVGRVGAGKSTLFSVLVGRRRPDGGVVRWKEERWHRARLWRLARCGVCFAPDRPWLAPRLTGADHLRMIDPGNGWLSLAEELGITDWLETRVGALSGGELRLTEVAVALARRPGAIVLDEPFRGLAPLYRDRVGRALRAAAARGVAVLYADHDARLVQETADRLFSIEQGMTRPVSDFRDRPLHEWYHGWPQ